jgi:hypothetical protein
MAQAACAKAFAAGRLPKRNTTESTQECIHIFELDLGDGCLQVHERPHPWRALET